MGVGDVLVLAVVGVLAGALNAAVGSGSLLTYPALVTLGLPPVVANGTNSLGVIPGSLAGAWAYRQNLAPMWAELKPRVLAVGGGAILGAGLVVVLPSEVFAVVVPWLILIACLVIALQPFVMRSLRPVKRNDRTAVTVMGAVGVYGGYFGAGQGIAQLAALTAVDGSDIHRANAQKNVLAAAANSAAAVIFVISGYVLWLPALIVGAATFVGGIVGGSTAKRLPPWALRTVIVAVGLYAVFVSFRALM